MKTSARHLPSLLPTGTARARFLGPAASGDDALPADLRQVLAARDVGDATLLAAWEAARWAAGALPAQRRAFVCLVVAVLEAVEAGGTFLALGARLEDALARLGLEASDRRGAGALAMALMNGTAAPSFAALVGPPDARRPFILAGEALYPERLWAAEERLVKALRARIAADTPKGGRVGLIESSIEAALDAVARAPGATPLADEQRAAVRAALEQPLTVVTGGPGSGKTSVVIALLRALRRLHVPLDRIALAAPTGRAAQRINESIQSALVATADIEGAPAEESGVAARFEGAVTLHRLLGIRPGRARPLDPDQPAYYDAWPLPHRYVIVDEASMIDLVTMGQLVAAVSPDARLVLLGDAAQLPSVQVGAVLRDLVAGVPACVLKLERSHRMRPEDPAGAQILRVATAVNTGASLGDEATTAPRARASELSLTGFERLVPNKLGELLDRWHGELLGADTLMAEALEYQGHASANADPSGVAGADLGLAQRLLAMHAASRILCVTRTAGRTTSAEAINRAMHTRVQAAAFARGRGGISAPAIAAAELLPGEPVIVLRNDHVRGLSNGDVGVVLRLGGARDGLGVVFARRDGVVTYALDDLRDHIDLAFALTVHKAQGSEYDRVALVLPEIDVPLLSREILYTAITRARRGVVIVGDPALFAAGAARTLHRPSAVAEKLRGD